MVSSGQMDARVMDELFAWLTTGQLNEVFPGRSWLKFAAFVRERAVSAAGFVVSVTVSHGCVAWFRYPIDAYVDGDIVISEVEARSTEGDVPVEWAGYPVYRVF